MTSRPLRKFPPSLPAARPAARCWPAAGLAPVLPAFLPVVMAVVMAVILLAAMATPLAAQGPAAITLDGRAVNGTAGGSVPANMPITLHVIDGDAGRMATYDATTDDRGEFAFEGVSPQPGGSYVLVMDYADMRYNTLLEAADLTEPAELTVYEITRDISVIEVERQAMIIADVDAASREIHVLEVVRLGNTGDRTLLPELTNITNPADINFLRFSLPAGASELDVQSTLPGGDIIPMGTGFAVTAPVLPGGHQIAYTYKFPYQDDAVAFNQRLIQGAGEYQVLAPVSLAQIGVSPLEPKPRIDVDGTPYLVWEDRDIPPRRGVVLEFSQLPQPGLATRIARSAADGDLWLAVIPVALAAALTLLLLYGWLRGPRAAPAGPAPDPAAQRRRQSLVQAVALLDEGFEQGRVAEGEYRPRREELLERLRRAAGTAGGSGGSGEEDGAR